MKHIKPEEITDNVIKLIGKDWMPVTAARPAHYNTMTPPCRAPAFLRTKPVVSALVRPERHTYGFMEREDVFTLSFFDEKYRKALSLCGTKSGRDTDKAAETGLTPVETSNGSIAFSQARLVLECRKLYVSDLKSEKFLDKTILEKCYDSAHGGLHRVYVAEITGVISE